MTSHLLALRPGIMVVHSDITYSKFLIPSFFITYCIMSYSNPAYDPSAFCQMYGLVPITPMAIRNTPSFWMSDSVSALAMFRVDSRQHKANSADLSALGIDFDIGGSSGFGVELSQTAVTHFPLLGRSHGCNCL